MLGALANTDFMEQMGDDDINSSSRDKINPDKAVEGHGIAAPTPLKGEKSLKETFHRHS